MRSEEKHFSAIGKYSAKEHQIGGSSHRVSIEAFLLKRIKDLGEILGPTTKYEPSGGAQEHRQAIQVVSSRQAYTSSLFQPVP